MDDFIRDTRQGLNAWNTHIDLVQWHYGGILEEYRGGRVQSCIGLPSHKYLTSQIMAETTLNQAKKLLVAAVRTRKTRRDLEKFFDDLLTEEEILDLGQRLRIAELIIEGKTYEEIAKEASVSTSTVSKIGQILKYGKGGLKNAIKRKRKTFTIYPD